MSIWFLVLVLVLILSAITKAGNEGDKWRQCIFQSVLVTNITVLLISI